MPQKDRSWRVGRKSPLNMRTTRALREKLDKAAGWSGRSLVQEVEHRVEHSFAQEELRQRAFFGQGSSATLMSGLRLLRSDRGVHRQKLDFDDVYARDVAGGVSRTRKSHVE